MGPLNCSKIAKYDEKVIFAHFQVLMEIGEKCVVYSYENVQNTTWVVYFRTLHALMQDLFLLKCDINVQLYCIVLAMLFADI